MTDERVPLFLAVDVEPDQKLDVGPHGPASWSGVAAIRDRLQNVRARLEDVTGSEFRVGWYLRMDPQIEALCGTADHAARRFGDDLHQLVSTSGAYLGLHVHATQWHDAKQMWVAETQRPDVRLEHLQVGLDAFTGCMGTAPLRHRFTTDVKSRAMVTALRRAGVGVDLKPADTPRLHYFERPAREPYLPTGSAGREGPWIIPATSTTWSQLYGGSTWRRAARRLRRGPFKQVSVDPYRGEQGPIVFWDRVARSIADLPRPYVSIAFRTERQDSWEDARHQAVLEALVDHRLARTLRFADPLEFASTPGQVTDSPRAAARNDDGGVGAAVAGTARIEW
jgi:hypothetical protein